MTEDGSSAEIAVVGNEGVVGISVFMGGKATPTRAVVQSVASAERLRAQVLQKEFKRGGELQVLLALHHGPHHADVADRALLPASLGRAAALSLAADEPGPLAWKRAGDDAELIADMLGVRRQNVTEAARKLQADGLIRYARGRITALDRPGLERRVCECYTVVKKEYERLLSNGS